MNIINLRDNMQKYQNFYFHSVRFNFEILESILKNGYILSREKAGIKESNVTFNGQKWISICKYFEYYPWLDEELFRSAFQNLVVDGLAIVLNGDIKATKTLFTSYDDLYSGLIKENNLIRYSDCVDEYQIRDSISKEHFLAILYPLLLKSQIDKEKACLEYQQIKTMLIKYNYKLPILDSSFSMIDSELNKLEKNLKNK